MPDLEKRPWEETGIATRHSFDKDPIHRKEWYRDFAKTREKPQSFWCGFCLCALNLVLWVVMVLEMWQLGRRSGIV